MHKLHAGMHTSAKFNNGSIWVHSLSINYMYRLQYIPRLDSMSAASANAVLSGYCNINYLLDIYRQMACMN